MMVHEEKKDMENKRREPGFEAECKGSGIMVSVCCITYNQVSYIRDALEGFVNQQTDFAYEVLIHDDASSDGTAEIIREYAKRYPDRIFPILQTENQYSKGLTNVSGTFNFPRARGKYIAMCEGDDYWTDMHKLQKQVDYLEANPGCSLCFHSAKIEVQGKALTEHAMRPYMGSRMISPEEIIDKTSGYPTASLMFYREMVAELPEFYNNAPIADIPLQLVWNYVQPINGTSRHAMNDEMFYYYHIAHMAKHFVHGGCGVRPFADLWLYNRVNTGNTNKRNKLLSDGELLKFSEEAENLAAAWFGNKEYNEITQEMEDYILQGGVYGTLKQNLAMSQNKKGGKFRHLMSRIFLSYKDMASDRCCA